MSSEKFYVWDVHWQTGRRHKVSCESWPGPFCEPCDAETEFAVAYVKRWMDDPDFPDHPFRDANSQIILPASLDTSPADYCEANEPPAPAPEPAVRYPFSGPANIVRGPATSAGTIAAYEASRRGLKPVASKPAPAPYQAPTPPVSSHTPSTPAAPPIAPRYFEPDPNHAKYKRPGHA